MAAAARSALRSATTSSRSAAVRLSAGVKPRAASSPSRFSNQKPLSALNSRCLRKIDLKRSTSSMGIVERIEYDPNRTSRIALVRWEGGAHQRKCNTVEEVAPPQKRLESATTTTVRGSFAFSSLPKIVDQRNVACSSPPEVKAGYVVVGHPSNSPSTCLKKSYSTSSNDAGSKKTSAKDVFLSTLSREANGETASFCSSSGFPRIAVAGARPSFFVFQMREEVRGKDTFSLSEIQKWKTDSIRWEHRIKPKAALSWQSFRRQGKVLGLVGASKHDELKPKMDQGFYTKGKKERCKVGRAPISYILASNQLEAGKMVMNWSKPSTTQNANAY